MDWLDEIEARAEAAMPGEWQFNEDCNEIVNTNGDNVISTSWYDGPILNITEEDANFVMASRKDVPKLVAEVRRLRTVEESLVVENASLRAELEAAKRDIRDMLRADCSEEHCEKCKTHKKGLVCMIGNCDNAEWRGATENGGANEAD